ncbi:MAG: response regulator [Blastocatellia bacterium]
MEQLNIAEHDFIERQSLLIIDDDKDWTDLLKLYFIEKYEVQVANSSCEAMAIIRAERPSVMIVDLVMPTIDGFGIIHRLHDLIENRIPTILLTGWNTVEVEECAASVGCDAVLSKPIELNALDEVVSFFMSHTNKVI